MYITNEKKRDGGAENEKGIDSYPWKNGIGNKAHSGTFTWRDGRYYNDLMLM